jgi:hypothetical protein
MKVEILLFPYNITCFGFQNLLVWLFHLPYAFFGSELLCEKSSWIAMKAQDGIKQGMA